MSPLQAPESLRAECDRLRAENVVLRGQLAQARFQRDDARARLTYWQRSGI